MPDIFKMLQDFPEWMNIPKPVARSYKLQLLKQTKQWKLFTKYLRFN